MSKTVAVAEFEAHPREVLDEVAQTREEVVVTEDGKPLAKVVPVGARRARTIEEIRAWGGQILGDIVAPHSDEPVAIDGSAEPLDASREEHRQKALEELRTKYPVQIAGDIVEPLDDEWDVMK